MKQIRVKNTSDQVFNKAWNLYEQAFPLEERRSIDAQCRVMKNPNYHFDILRDEEQWIGFLLWWDLESLRYIDHFATDAQLRNKGFGKLILEKFMASNDKPILLEVELPTSHINKRRIKFYERIGFKQNLHPYEVPAPSVGHAPLPFLLMSYPDTLSALEVEQFVKINHPIIFKD